MATGVSAAMAVFIAPQPNVTASPNMDNERFSTVLEIMLLICHSCQITCLGNAWPVNCPGKIRYCIFLSIQASRISKASLCQFSYACFPGYFGLSGQWFSLPVESSQCAGCAKPVQDAPTQAMTAAQSSRLRVFCASTVCKAEIGHCVV